MGLLKEHHRILQHLPAQPAAAARSGSKVVVSVGGGYGPSAHPPTWEQRRVSRFGSWKMRASCSTAPFSMP
jgi:hypothetical protein